MRRLIVLAALFAAMCVATSNAKPIETILIDGDYLWADPGGQAVIDFFTNTYPDATVTSGSYSDTANAGVRATIEAADMLVINRRTYSGGYDAADGAYYSSLDIPVIFLTSYVTRSSKINYEGGEQGGGDVTGAETTVTAAGAAFLGVAEGTYDWLATGADTLGTGSVGTGKILATVSGNNLAVFWDIGDTDAAGRTQVGKRLLWNLNATSGGTVAQLPDTAAGLQAFTDAVKACVEKEDIPHNPTTTPLNPDGSVGTVLNAVQATVTLGWNAPVDPDSERAYPVNPAIAGHYVYLSDGNPNDDPNVHLLDFVPQIHADDPYETNPYNEYGLLTLQRGVTYYWQVEGAISDGEGLYPPGDPNNLMGELWSFVMVSATVSLTAASPAYTAMDAGNDLVVSVVGAGADTYQWHKIGDPDVALENGDEYSGVDTDTLTIYDVQLADEGYYYCVATNSLPSTASNRDTGPARVMTKRLMNHYAMESMDYDADPNGITPDAVSGFDMRMASNDTGTDVPVLEANTVPGLAGSYSLKFNNPRATPADPNNVDAQYAQIDEGMLVAYQDITISAWVYNSGGSNWNRIVDFGNDNANYVFLCLNPLVNNAVRFAVNIGGTEQSVTSPAEAVPVGEWTFITATLSGNTGRIYVNGERVGVNTSLSHNPISITPTTQNWLARSQWGAGDGYFNGLLDDLKIFNYGLSAQEVANEYLSVMTDTPWVCDREAWQADTLMAALDVNDDCRIDMIDLAAFAGKWLEDTYQLNLE